MALSVLLKDRANGFYGALTPWNIGGLALAYLAYRITWALYNFSPFHPLSRVPGPKIAAMTRAYECYYDLIKWGRYAHEIKKMHEIYGRA